MRYPCMKYVRRCKTELHQWLDILFYAHAFDVFSPACRVLTWQVFANYLTET